MLDRTRNIVGLGELLWDIFPDAQELGGAPANFAYMTSLLGDEGIVASRVGGDLLGRKAGRRLERLGLRSIHLQRDKLHPTGTVKVQVAADGQPSFEIAESVAWDFLAWTPEWHKLAEQTDAVCFGTLAQRSEVSRQTIRRFLQTVRPGTLRVFDVNLRQSFFSAQLIRESAQLADVIKLNHDELQVVAQLLNLPLRDEVFAAQTLRKMSGAKLICVTRGENGSVLFAERETNAHPGVPIKVADAVGAGDAFTAALVHHYLRGAPLSALNEAANRMGAWVTSHTGATPPRDDVYLKGIRTVGD
jgi:fructokinase